MESLAITEPKVKMTALKFQSLYCGQHEKCSDELTLAVPSATNPWNVRSPASETISQGNKCAKLFTSSFVGCYGANNFFCGTKCALDKSWLARSLTNVSQGLYENAKKIQGCCNNCANTPIETLLCDVLWKRAFNVRCKHKHTVPLPLHWIYVGTHDFTQGLWKMIHKPFISALVLMLLQSSWISKSLTKVLKCLTGIVPHDGVSCPKDVCKWWAQAAKRDEIDICTLTGRRWRLVGRSMRWRREISGCGRGGGR